MNNEAGMIINTFTGDKAREDEKKIRTIAVQREVPLFTTISAAGAVAYAIEALRGRKIEVKALQDYHAELAAHDSRGQSSMSLFPRPDNIPVEVWNEMPELEKQYLSKSDEK
jgi:hypothetical protein